MDCVPVTSVFIPGLKKALLLQGILGQPIAPCPKQSMGYADSRGWDKSSDQFLIHERRE